MDVDRQYSLVKALDGNTDKPKQFFLSSGANGSTLEHSVPEQLWSTPDNPAYGISAVKALKIANDQGIPIYTINQSNIDTILSQLQIDTDAKTDIRNAVNAGKEVTVSKTNITYNGWTGCGYIIIDPDTGEGAYMISGGMNGAFIAAVVIFLTAIAFFALAIAVTFLVPGLGAVIASSIFILTGYIALMTGVGILVGQEGLFKFVECLGHVIGEVMVVTTLFGLLDAIKNIIVKVTKLILEAGFNVKHAESFVDCIKDLGS